MNEKTIETSHGQIAVYDTPGDGIPVLMIHANSHCKETFHFQIEALAGTHHIIAIDLPGHGQSSDAIDPLRTYNFNGYADTICELIDALNINRFALLGHSLGGHVALELMRLLPEKTAGTMIFGTPPIPPGPEGAALGFLPNPEFANTGKETLSEHDIDMVVALALGSDAVHDTFWKTAVRRTDGRSRQLMIDAALAGKHSDQRALVKTSPVPLAIVNGADDPLINLDYIDSLTFANLWESGPVRVENAAHGVHWQRHKEFNVLLDGFLSTIV
ncbi:pimeloyl-ACP methyl ester carboxylesterase [Rhizobium sp. PP-F2F-G48]|uniref:alpha/beta fold hydrolase n=1 Tax=Rhizobium sp. PP-F2F-G48 TaxID=2135651 RepID=UPI001047C65B|nr:alpha/beta hydrolase [Rhizobium sp. PP-F2F-G48]TCM48328.1 pimeloyl-ACP methyl ester carboxylesterase [Rhizobium sp. PP-F2F-G48]